LLQLSSCLLSHFYSLLSLCQEKTWRKPLFLHGRSFGRTSYWLGNV
jgi:hypothetical protein